MVELHGAREKVKGNEVKEATRHRSWMLSKVIVNTLTFILTAFYQSCAKECHDVTYILKGLLQLVGREQTVERDRQNRETHWEFITIAWLRNNGGLGQGNGSEVGEKS